MSVLVVEQLAAGALMLVYSSLSAGLMRHTSPACTLLLISHSAKANVTASGKHLQ
jgi:hypothetical protein